jgi:carbon storage regulator CsrA
MLVLSRKINEAIVIDGSIRITMTSISNRQVRLGIDAPPDVRILREELLPDRPHVGPGREQPLASGGPLRSRRPGAPIRIVVRGGQESRSGRHLHPSRRPTNGREPR